MSDSAPVAAETAAPAGLSPATIRLFALACGATVANIYYAQSLVGPIAQDLDMPANLSGLVVTITQIGYGAGLFLIVCLGDLLENRRLILTTTAAMIASLAGLVASRSTMPFLVFSFVLGMASVGTQVLVPLAAHLSSEASRGRVIGNIMGGLIAGIMLSRPLASVLSAHFGWRAVFFLSILLMMATYALLWKVLPQRRPRPGIGYAALLASILRWLASSRPLQRRTMYQGALFGAFNLFWTAAPLMLHARFGLEQNGIALFALAGAGGALAAPWAGRVADRGLTRLATGLVIVVAGVAFFLSGVSVAWRAMPLLALAAIALDAAVQANQVLSQRVVYTLSSEARGRLNAAYMTVVFLCGAVGSILGSLSFVDGGWWITTLIGIALCGAATILFATEKRRH